MRATKRGRPRKAEAAKVRRLVIYLEPEVVKALEAERRRGPRDGRTLPGHVARVLTRWTGLA